MPKMKRLGQWMAAALVLLSGGCNTVQHVEYQDNGAAVGATELVGFNRKVEVHVDPSIGRVTADCVTVVPAAGPAGRSRPPDQSRAMARHLRDRFATVVGPDEALEQSRRLAVDLAHPGDRAVYARALRCPLFVDLRPWGAGSTYMVVWSRRTAGAEARLSDATGERLYWRARHSAVRAEGGLAFSPFGILVNAFEATNLENDADLNASLAGDLARRLVATLPELLPSYGSPRLAAGRSLDTPADRRYSFPVQGESR